MGLPLPEPLHEGIPKAWFSGTVRMPEIFIEEPRSGIDADNPFLSGCFQGIDASQNAVRPGLVILEIGNHENICIHNDAGSHDALFSPFNSRCILALVIAAISSNSSPKNPSGQFSMSPKRFRANGFNSETPSRISQK